jgi:acyl carrier protein
MNKEILSKVQEIVRTELDNQDLVLDVDTLTSEIEDWDSISIIQILGALEVHYSITFDTLDIQNWKNIGALCQSIQSLI